MDINKLNEIELKIKKIREKQTQIELIKTFMRDMKVSKVLDLHTEWGSAPSITYLSNLNDLRMNKSEIYNLIGKDISNLLEEKLLELETEIENFKIKDLLIENDCLPNIFD